MLQVFALLSGAGGVAVAGEIPRVCWVLRGVGHVTCSCQWFVMGFLYEARNLMVITGQSGVEISGDLSFILCQGSEHREGYSLED